MSQSSCKKNKGKITRLPARPSRTRSPLGPCLDGTHHLLINDNSSFLCLLLLFQDRSSVKARESNPF